MSAFESNIKGKAGILTGGSSGFGFEMAKAIVARGGRLAVFSADEISDAGRREVEAAGDGEAVFLHQDITASGAAKGGELKGPADVMKTSLPACFAASASP